jgi:hypothetical protein
MSPLQYALLSRIRDPILRDALKLVQDRITALETQITALGTLTAPLTTNLDAASHRLTALANPTADQDAVTLRYLKTFVENRLTAAGLIGPDGQAAQPADSDNGETARGVADAGADGDIGTGELTAYRAGLIIGGTANEYPALVAVAADQATRDANQLELLLRTIWHLNQAGFTAGRQRNPSGLLSQDKIAVVEAGVTRAFDVYTGTFDVVMTVQALQVAPANLVADSGTPD